MAEMAHMKTWNVFLVVWWKSGGKTKYDYQVQAPDYDAATGAAGDKSPIDVESDAIENWDISVYEDEE